MAVLLIVAATVAAYSNSFHGPFVFDDIGSIQDNASIRRLWAWDVLTAPEAARRPVANLSFALNYALGRLDVRGYHATNLLIHLLAALLLFGIVRRTLRLPPLRDRFETAADALAAAVALIWAVHPLQTGAVTYLVQRMESLMGLFYLLTLYGAIRGATSARPRRWYAAAVAACAVGAGAKEVMVTAPVVVLLYDRAFLAGSFLGALRRRWALYAGLAATWGILGLLLLKQGMAGTTGAGFGLQGVTPWEYARSQPGVILHYLRLCFWPHPLCLDYGWPVATAVEDIAPPALAVGLLLAAVLWAMRRAPRWGFLGAAFFLILAPTSSVMPIFDLCFEHRMYLPLAAVVAAGVVGAWAWAGPRLRGRGAVAACAAALVGSALAATTFARNADYRSDLSIWQDVIEKRPANPRGYNGRGLAHYERKRYAQAIEDFDRAIALKPDYASACNSRALACERLGRYAEAVRDADRAIERMPALAAAYNTRAMARAGQRDYARAIGDYDRAIELQPAYAAAYYNRANAHSARRDWERALADYSRAIDLKHDYAAAYYNRGNVHADAGRPLNAVEDYTRALAIKPDYAEALNNRATVYYELKEYARAWADVQAYRALGGQPSAEFLQVLTRAGGPNR